MLGAVLLQEEKVPMATPLVSHAVVQLVVCSLHVDVAKAGSGVTLLSPSFSSNFTPALGVVETMALLWYNFGLPIKLSIMTFEGSSEFVEVETTLFSHNRSMVAAQDEDSQEEVDGIFCIFPDDE